MHSHILTFIILPNVGYWSGSEIIDKKLLSHTKKVLSTIETSDINKIVHQIDGIVHHDNDLPAIEWCRGTKEWYKKGKRHRENDLPAVIWENGDKWWYKNGKRHRDGNLPAMEFANGVKWFYKNGKFYLKE